MAVYVVTYDNLHDEVVEVYSTLERAKERAKQVNFGQWSICVVDETFEETLKRVGLR